MSIAAVLVIAMGGALGACARYLIERGITVRQRGVMPWGLFTVNVVGSALAGAALAGTSGLVRTFLLVGLCGALTTYSGFGAAVRALWSRDRAAAWVTIFGMTSACIVAVALASVLVSQAS